MKLKLSVIALVALLPLSACGGEEVSEEEASTLSPRSAEIGLSAAYKVASGLAGGSMQTMRPTAPLGIFVSSFLAQGSFVDVASAQSGVDAQMKLIQGQSVPTTSETFTLLTELATVMQVNIPDMLNRSTDRAKALNDYIDSLRATGEVAQRKYQELEVREEQLRDERRGQREEVSQIERAINEAFRAEDYATAAQQQEKLTEAEAALAQTDTKMDQTGDIKRRYEDMIEIAAERLEAVVRNREILIAGLHVTDVPGIENLEILDESKQYRRSRRSDDDDLFGTQYIQ